MGFLVQVAEHGWDPRRLYRPAADRHRHEDEIQVLPLNPYPDKSYHASPSNRIYALSAKCYFSPNSAAGLHPGTFNHQVAGTVTDKS